MVTLRESGAGVKPGSRFGRRVVLGWQFHVATRFGPRFYVVVRCDCGSIDALDAGIFARDRMRHSCGCKRFGSDTHPKPRQSPEERRLRSIWRNMIRRCHDPKVPNYERYGARGIRVCDEWRNDVHVFISWAKKSGYANDLTIDRINNDGNYRPDNCRWATFKEQGLNKRPYVRGRRGKMIDVNGEVKNQASWAIIVGISASQLGRRLRGCECPGEAIAAMIKKVRQAARS